MNEQEESYHAPVAGNEPVAGSEVAVESTGDVYGVCMMRHCGNTFKAATVPFALSKLGLLAGQLLTCSF